MTKKVTLPPKEKQHWLRKNAYYLGRLDGGPKCYLEEASWDCDWYWGFGYVETYNRKKDDIESHQHFDGLFLGNANNMPMTNLTESPLTDKEKWELLELMKCFYILKEAAALFGRGGSHISGKKKTYLFSTFLSNRINKIMLPRLFKEVYKILAPKELKAAVAP